MTRGRRELSASELRRICVPQSLGFATTDELADLDRVLGQQRAVEAIELGVGLRHEGFNLFVLGPRGSGRHSVVRERLERAAAGEPAARDWAYVHNFRVEHKPRALALPPGRGARLRDDMKAVVEELGTALATAFESEDYHTRRQVIDEEFKEREAKAFGDLGQRAEKHGLAMLRTPLGVAFAPAREGEVLSPQEFESLPVEDRQGRESALGDLRVELERLLRQLPRWQRERRGRLRGLNEEIARFTVHPLVDELRERYRDLAEVVSYLDDVEEDVTRRAPTFVADEASHDDEPMPFGAGRSAALRRYQVNLIVEHGEAEGAPLIVEDHPSFQNLCGRVEHIAQMGALVTDFLLIKPGALHRANGGYLVLDALQVLRQPFAWEALLRALRTGELRLESLAQSLSLVSTVSLEPEPIPLDVKVVLVGERLLYYLLAAYEPDFQRLFKVAADFDDQLEWSDDQQALYARLVATLVRRAGLAAFDSAAVARVLEWAAREEGDAQRLTLAVAALEDLLCEANEARRRAGREVATAADVEAAVAARERRAGRLRERLLEETLRGTRRIATSGEAVGQVNGLSVVTLGGYAFGHPTRISARVRLGGGELVDIEREAKLAGPIHSKGVMILAGFVGERYAAEQPLSLAASLVFEQSYGGVEGDSASLAELCALLSAVAGLPLRQSLAVTGSVDQHGQAQAVGGVDEKVEGFFDLCAARGLDGEQGVIVPAANVDRLMLKQEVVEAVTAGRFHVWAVETIDEALELLCGRPAGERDAEGVFPEGSVNRAVADRLATFAATRQAYVGGAQEMEGEE